MKIDNITRKLIKTIKTPEKKTSPYDASGVVARVEDGIAWTRIAGSKIETPVQMTINASPGDEVQVRVGGGTAWLVGNGTAPPTDNTLAKLSYKVGKAASAVADSAYQYILEHFVEVSDGLYIISDNSRYKMKVKSDGIEILDPDGVSVAEFGTTARVGATDGNSVEIQTDEMIMGQAGLPLFSVKKTGNNTVGVYYNGACSLELDTEETIKLYGTVSEDHSGYDVATLLTSHGQVYLDGTSVTSGSIDSPVAAFTISITGAVYAEGPPIAFFTQSATVTASKFTISYDSGTSTVTVTLLDDYGDGGMVEYWYYTEVEPVAYIAGVPGSGSLGDFAMVEGIANAAYGKASHTEGYGNTAASKYSHAEGSTNSAQAACAHAEGASNAAYGEASHAEGAYNYIASAASYSHVEGEYNNVYGDCAHAEGYNSIATGNYSHSAGYYTKAGSAYQTVIGKANVVDSAETYIFIAGNGSDNSNRSDALELDWSGNMTIAGTLTQSSDRRLKEHYSFLGDEAVDFVRKLMPAFFKKDGGRHTGFYAQDVQEADPYECMTGEMNGYMTLGYTELIAPLVAYCQSLERRIEKLEKGGNA